MHASLGSPLGPAFAAEVWALAKTFVAASLALGGFGGFVVANNRRAWDALDEAADGDADDAHGGQGHLPLPPPRPITSRANPARPATGRQGVVVTDTVRKRRTGRLTPVETLPALPPGPPEPGAAVVRKDGVLETPASAEPAGASDRKARQAGGGSP